MEGSPVLIGLFLVSNNCEKIVKNNYFSYQKVLATKRPKKQSIRLAKDHFSFGDPFKNNNWPFE